MHLRASKTLRLLSDAQGPQPPAPSPLIPRIYGARWPFSVWAPVKIRTGSAPVNEPVGNLGAVFDPNMNMSAHVSKGIKSANYHLRNIGKIRKFLNTDTTKSVPSSHW